MKTHVHNKGGCSPTYKSISLRRFAEKEDGTFTIFVLIGFLAMLAVTGIGVDLMKFERDRATLQSTLDRAVLAAADLDQTESPKTVVESYLDKAGLLEKLKDVKVEDSFGSRKVLATAESVIPTNFMSYYGILDMTATATSAAEESIGAVEISLVLDISGSMRWASADRTKSKIEVLKKSASDFVRLMLDKEGESQISISVIPYATQVNAGETLLNKFNDVTSEHNYSHCVNFIPEQYSDSDLERNDRLERTAHFDPFTYSEGTIDTPVCPVRPGSAITPLTDNMDKLLAEIGKMTPKGNTSIDVGMKWGVALLDPSMRGIVKDLSAEEDLPYSPKKIVPAKFANRPSDYGGDVLKIAIVMTDGQNTDQFMLNPSLREGYSDVWYNADSGANRYWYDYYTGRYHIVSGDYSVFHSEGNPHKFIWPQQGRGVNQVWNDHPYGSPNPETASNQEPGTAIRLTYPELLNRASLEWIAEYNYHWQPSAQAEWTDKAYAKVETAAKNQHTKHVCDAAKDQGIIVYGIAFEAPRAGYRTIKDCASSASHVYDVNGLDLEDAFASIASSIRKLRLTQ